MKQSIYTNTTAEKWLCENAAANNVPINAILELTPLCNMNCEMCFIRLSPEEQNSIGKLRTLDEWKAVADEMQKAGTLFVLLTGGEPLTYPHFKELYLYLKKLGMIITINTNGTLLDEAWADFFAKHKPRRINITVYGKDDFAYDRLCRYKGGFEKTVNAIQLLTERNVDVKLNGSITPFNMEDWDDLVQLARNLGVTWKIDTYMYPASRERKHGFDENARLSPQLAARIRINLMEQENEHFEEFAKEFVKTAENTAVGEDKPMTIPCRAGTSSFVINWQGQMRPCVMVTKPEVSVFAEGFMTAWKELGERVAQIRLSSKCGSCTMRKVCQTCAACALLETGSYDGVPEYMCQYTKESIRLMKEYLNKKSKEKVNG